MVRSLHCVAAAAFALLALNPDVVQGKGSKKNEQKIQIGWKQIRPSMNYQWRNGSGGCTGLQCGCTELEEVPLDPRSGEEAGPREDIGEIRAVKYWPEPIGHHFVNRSGKDPYSWSYADIHRRDLPMMKNELGVNTVLLGPWAIKDNSHAEFLDRANAHSLRVIPSFDIAWYWKDGNWQNGDTHLALQSDFREFLENAAERTPYTSGVVLMWNIVGLPDATLLLPRQCLVGASTDVLNLKNCFSGDFVGEDAVGAMRELQAILEIIRVQQSAFFCTRGPDTPKDCEEIDDAIGPFMFDRPLALTVELGADFSLLNAGSMEYLQAFIFWMERVLGCRTLLDNQINIFATFNETLSFCRFHGRGFFDAWIFKVVAASSEVEARSMQSLLGTFVEASQMNSSDATKIPLEAVAGVMKPVIFEYGFAAITPMGALDATKQHRLLRQVWAGSGRNVSGAWSNGLCVRGAAIDEWVDVWSADRTYPECDKPSSPFRHSMCGPSSDAGTVSVGFMGIMGQFDTLLMHCLDQRVDNPALFRFLSVEEIDGISMVQRPFGIKQLYGESGMCRFVWLRPGMAVSIWLIIMALTVLVFCVFCCSELGPCRRGGRAARAQGKDRNAAMLVMQSEATRKVLSGISTVRYGKVLADMVADALQDENRQVPVRYQHLEGYTGWGLKKRRGTFSYHRLQYDGLGLGRTVKSWEAQEEFVKWLQEQSDYNMAVLGFEDEELRRPELIGNKTVTYRQLLEMLDSAGKFEGKGEEAKGEGEEQVDCLGVHMRFTLRLKYRACPVLLSDVLEDGPRPGAYTNPDDWLSEVGVHVKRYLDVLANSHLKVQKDRLCRQLRHEELALQADDAKRKAALEDVTLPEAGDGRPMSGWFTGGQQAEEWASEEAAPRDRACYNVWRRACEGVHKWQEKHDEYPDINFRQADVQRYFAEALLLRVLESAGEHIIHAPDWLARVFFKARGELTLTPASDGQPWACTLDVDYADLYEPIQEFCRNSNVFSKKQGINFDDINDHGLSSKEPPQPKGLTKTFREPRGQRVLFNTIVNYQWPLTVVLWLLTFSLFLRDQSSYSSFAGKVGTTGGDHRVSVFVILLVDLAWLFIVNFSALFVWTPVTVHTCMCTDWWFPYLLNSIYLTLIIPAFVLVLWVEFEFKLEQTQMQQLADRLGMSPETIRSNYAVAPFLFLAARLVCGLCNCGMIRKRDKLRLRTVEQARTKKRVMSFWFVFSLICFATYYTFLIPMIRTLTAKNLCQMGDPNDDFCEARRLDLGHKLPTWEVYDSQCVACMTSVVCAWLLTVVGSMLIPYFTFNCCVSFIGSSLGVARGLVETDISSLDFSVDFLTSTFSQQRKAEAGVLSHGTVLQAIYGRHWQEVWKVMVNGLFDECLINGKLCEKMIKEAEGGGKVDLADSEEFQILPLARRRIGYLFASHREILGNPIIEFSPYQDNDDDVRCDALGMCHRGTIPSLTQIIPVYSEDGIMSIKELLDKGAVSTTLEFLISQFPDEWKIFAETEKPHPAELYSQLEKLHPAELYSQLASGKCPKPLQDKVREWASHRAQSVIRTVNGAIHYHKALKLLLAREGDVSLDTMRDHVQLILAHQTYGQIAFDKGNKAQLQEGKLTFNSAHNLKVEDTVRLSRQVHLDRDAPLHEVAVSSPEEVAAVCRDDLASVELHTVKSVSDDKTVVLEDTTWTCRQVLSEKVETGKREEDLHYMLRKHEGYPFFVAIDFHRGKTHPRLQKLIDDHVQEQGPSGGEAPVRFKFASVLIRYRGRKEDGGDAAEWPVEVVHVLPRARGLLVGSAGDLSQGKSGNQLGALRFAEGHFLQMMDANMGCYAGESFKVPVVLRGFYSSPKKSPHGEHRRALRARIIGFREHIFTRAHGLVGTIMADSEWTFGTLVQRLLGFLNVRMHYGHPDFMDCFWASNRGSVSKASPTINLSEDIFAGLNVSARNERSLHTDILEWEKGREVQFFAGSGFFWKISSGSVGLMRTRDLSGLCGRATIMQSVALYFATVAWYVHNILVDYGTELYVLLFIFLTLSSKSLADIGELGSALAVEWFITPALSATLPAVFGFGVEYGPWWLITQYLPTVPASMMYFIFINKSMSSSVRSTIWSNKAEYVNTGRPHANKSYSLKEAFAGFRTSHYVPAVSLLYLVLVYRLSNLSGQGALPMVMIVATSLCWIVAPVLFRPPTGGFLNQISELCRYIFYLPPSSSGHVQAAKATCLYEAALADERKKALSNPFNQLLAALALLTLYACMAVTIIWEQMPAPMFACAITFCVKATWRLSAMKQAGLVSLLLQLLLPVVCSFASLLVESFDLSSLLLAMVIFAHLMHTLKVLMWCLARVVRMLPKGNRLNYDRVVHVLFDFGLGYHLQVYAGAVVLIIQAACELLLWLLDHPRLRLRLRTRALLNKDIGHGCVARIYHWEGPASAHAHKADHPSSESATSTDSVQVQTVPASPQRAPMSPRGPFEPGEGRARAALTARRQPEPDEGRARAALPARVVSPCLLVPCGEGQQPQPGEGPQTPRAGEANPGGQGPGTPSSIVHLG